MGAAGIGRAAMSQVSAGLPRRRPIFLAGVTRPPCRGMVALTPGKENRHARLETPAGRRLPLRAGADKGECRAARHHGLSLHRLPEDERLGLLAHGRHPGGRLRGGRGGAGDRRPARHFAALFLPALPDLDLHAAGGHRLVRQCAPDHARRGGGLRALHRDLGCREAALRRDRGGTCL